MKKRNVAALIAAAVMAVSVLLTGCGEKADAPADNTAGGSRGRSSYPGDTYSVWRGFCKNV